MRVVHEEYFPRAHPPLLRMTIHGAPHRRIDQNSIDRGFDRRIIDAYRVCLVFAGKRVGIYEPIDHPIDLELTFVDPTSPDLDNLLTAFYQAVDGRAAGKRSLMVDDGLIQKVTVSKLFPADLRLPNPHRLQLPRYVIAEHLHVA